MFGFKLRRGTSEAKVNITSINIRMGNDVHGIGGMHVSGKIAKITIPFSNRIGRGLLPDNLKSPPITISGISAEKPFEVIEINPKLPVDVDYRASVSFNITLKVPEGNYEGPVNVRFETKSNDNIGLSIEKVKLLYEGREYDLENSTESMTVRSGQIIKKDIQMYKLLSFGDSVRKIIIGPPFELADSSPKLPIKIDRKDSYIVSLFIKCPGFSYAGPMLITFERG